MCSCNCGNTKNTKKIDKDIDNFQRENDKTIELALTATGKTAIKGAEPIQIKIDNNGTQSTILAPKLLITRTAGSHASIQDATDKGNGKYEIELNSSITKDLIIVPGADIKATFEFQLTYQDQPIRNKVIIHWDKGAAVALKDIKYNQGSGYITFCFPYLPIKICLHFSYIPN